MAKNDILKEAIADAKAVREVALSNAKAALEEAFTPRLQSMLSAKLSEELEEDLNEEEEIEENFNETTIEEASFDEMMKYGEDDQDDKEGYMGKSMEEEIDLEEILAELELEEVERKKSINDMIAQLNTEAIENEWERAYAELAIQEQQAMDELALLNATEAQKQAVRDAFAQKRDKLATEESKFNKKLDEMDAKAKLQLASNAFGQIASIVGENSKVGKAAAIAQTTIDTYQSATAAYKSLAGIPVYGPVLGGIAAAAAVAAGIANVTSIVYTPIPGGGGGGGDNGTGGHGGSGIVVVRGPSAVVFAGSPCCAFTGSTHPGGDKIAKFTASGTLTITRA